MELLKSLRCQLQTNQRNFQLKIGHKNRVYLKSQINKTELRKTLRDLKKFYIE